LKPIVLRSRRNCNNLKGFLEIAALEETIEISKLARGASHQWLFLAGAIVAS
jgi:hypothetical protein